MREISSGEVCRLHECLLELAAHHNRVSVNFKGCYPTIPFEKILENFVADIDSGKSYIAVIEKDSSVIGFCKVNITSPVGELEYLMVHDQYRGSGYGKMLIEWAAGKFESHGIHSIDVKVIDGNEAVSFYEKCGFKMNAHILRLCI